MDISSYPLSAVGNLKTVLADLELWRCEKGGLKPLHRLKVNQAREIKKAHHRHRGEAAGNFEPARSIQGM